MVTKNYVRLFYYFYKYLGLQKIDKKIKFIKNSQIKKYLSLNYIRFFLLNFILKIVAFFEKNKLLKKAIGWVFNYYFKQVIKTYRRLLTILN